MTPCRPRWILLAGLLAWLLLGVTLLAAAQSRSLEACDDAFISFRVARNLAAGHGLVFNPGGPPSEAASNFLYTALLGMGHAGGLPLLHVALALDLIFVALTLLLLAWLVARTVGKIGLWAAPALACLSMTHANAINGLETTMVGLLLLGAVAAYLRAGQQEERAGRWLILSSVLLALLSLTRPEGPLYLLVIGLHRGFRLLRQRHNGAGVNPRTEAAWLAPFVLIYLPYLLFRLLYFGQLLPNAYHAKDAFFSGASAKLAQGAVYFGTLCLMEPLLPLGLLAGIWLMRRAPNHRRSLLLLLVCTQSLFMVLSGGDWPHMFGHGRFLFPVLPFCIWLLADALYLALANSRVAPLACAASLLVCTQVDLVGLTGLKLAPHFHLGRQAGRPSLTRQAVARSYGRDLRNKPRQRWWRQATAAFRHGHYRASFDAQAGLWLKDNHGVDTPIAAIQAGQFAYWSEMSFFDLFGLATPGVSRLRDDGPGMMARLGASGVRLIAFYRWGDDMHNRGLVSSGEIWRAGYGVRHVLQRGTFRAFVVFERGHKSEVDPIQALTVPLKALPTLVGSKIYIPIP